MIAASVIDNFECGQVGLGATQSDGFSQLPSPIPVFGVDQVALKAQIPVSMSWTGTAPTAVQYRIEDYQGNAVSGYDWADAPNAILGASGLAMTVLAPVGTGATAGVYGSGNWRVAVRDKNNTAKVGRTRLFGVGDIFLGLGQSNMSKWSDPYLPATDNFAGAAWMLSMPAGGGTTGMLKPFSIATAGFHNTLIQKTGRPATVLNFGYSGQLASFLSPGDASGWFASSVAIVIRKYQVRATAMFIRQGEAECQQSKQATGLGWVGYWQLTLNGYAAAMGRRLTDIYVGVSLTGSEIYPATDAGSQIAKNYLAQRKLEKTLADSMAKGFVSHHSFDVVLVGDGIHLPPIEHYAKNGPRFAYAYCKAAGLGAVANDLSGPKVTSISRSGAVITAAVNLNGCAALSDNAGGTGTQGVGGWQLVAAPGYNGSQDPNTYFNTPQATPPLTVSSVAYSGSTITITLSADPGGPVALRYPAATSGGTPVFDGSSPFGPSYYQATVSGGTFNPATQIIGTGAPDGSTIGVFPIIDALAG
jgi:hypothetical protein